MYGEPIISIRGLTLFAWRLGKKIADGAWRRFRRQISYFPFALAVLAFSGCLGGPKYQSIRNPESAILAVGITPSDHGFLSVNVNRIDRLVAPTAQLSGVPSNVTEIYLTAGAHLITVLTSHRQDLSYGKNPGYYETTGAGNINATFMAAHRYHFAAKYNDGTDSFTVVLWDETNGVADRLVVGNWPVTGGGVILNY